MSDRVQSPHPSICGERNSCCPSSRSARETRRCIFAPGARSHTWANIDGRTCSRPLAHVPLEHSPAKHQRMFGAAVTHRRRFHGHGFWSSASGKHRRDKRQLLQKHADSARSCRADRRSARFGEITSSRSIKRNHLSKNTP